ncbi:hypothetical protein D6817_00100, partial [Candidatus Pacearchaeota archaeon]
DKEWALAEELRSSASCIACAQTCAIVDVRNFFLKYGLRIDKFTQLMLNISKALLRANSIQRSKSNECFQTIAELNRTHQNEFLSLARNYIRLWNFGLIEPGINQEFVLTMISEAKKKIDSFAAAEETIYKSCGMTTRFKLALAPTFPGAAQLSEAQYVRFNVAGADNLLRREFKRVLSSREAVGELFDGGDEVTFHYIGELDEEKIIRQVGITLASYKIPLFNYSFELRGDLKLTHFMS